MDQDEFWAIVAESRSRAGGQILGQTAALHELLSTRPLDDVLAFQRHLVTALDRAGSTDLAHAAGLLLGGVGDDSFQDFRTWLLCHGREVFERALADPDTVAVLTYDEDGEDFGEAERFGYVATDVYTERSGGELPDNEMFRPYGGDDGLYDEATLRTRLPRLFARAHLAHPEYLRMRELVREALRRGSEPRA